MSCVDGGRLEKVEHARAFRSLLLGKHKVGALRKIRPDAGGAWLAEGALS